jgi:MoxR-like ATPase
MNPASSTVGFTPTPSDVSSLQAEVERVFVGKSQVVQRALATFLAGGHLLIEDVPGVGKTTLALSLAKATGCTFQRIQFTSDLLPADILGVSVLNPRTQEFEFKKGPIFHQVILADELNRATPRTQSALLEAMNEHQITMDNQTHELPRPFFVLATQNPFEHHGAFPLPESQLDRFMMRITIGYPDTASEKNILRQHIDMDAVRHLEARLSLSEILALMDQVPQIKVASQVDDYILAIVQATRKLPQIEVGVSPRGALALRKACQAHALLQNRDYVTPDDVKSLAVAALAHRLIFSTEQVSATQAEAERLITSLLQSTAVPL